MKKKISILSSFIAIIALIFVIFGLVRATDNVNYTPTLKGVQIRTALGSVKQGFKFNAAVDDTVDFENDESILDHGFFIAKGEYTYDNLTTAIKNGETQITEEKEDNPRTSKIIIVHVKGTGNDFSVTLVGLENEDEEVQTQNFITDVTVVAFIKVAADNDAGYEYIFNVQEEHKVRNIAKIALNTLEGCVYDPNSYVHLIAASTCEYFVRSEMTDTKISVTSSIFEDDGVTLITTYERPENQFIKGDSIEVTTPIVSSKYYDTLSYSDGTNSYELGSTVSLSVGEYPLTFADWNGTAFVDSQTKVVNTDILSDGEGGYYSGAMVFNNITDAVNASGVKEVNVAAGTYSESFTISQSNITLLGANSETLGTAERTTETEIIGTVTLGAEVDNIIIQGFKFTGDSSVSVEVLSTTSNNTINNENIQFTNNYVDVETTANGFINLNDVEKWHSKDVIIDGNYFTGSAASGMIYTLSNMNMTVTNNTFENITTGKAIYLDDGNTNGVDGNLNISNNIFDTVAGEGIYVEYMAVPSYSSVTEVEYKINNNIFTNMTLDGIEFVTKVNLNSSESTLLQINGNTFDTIGGKGIIFPTTFTTSGNYIDFSISNNSFTNVTSNGIVFTASAPTISDVTSLFKINNNTFEVIGDKAIQLSNAGGTFTISGTDTDFQITGNTIVESTGTAIWGSTLNLTSTNTANLNINNNEILNSQYDGICINNITSTAESSLVNINDNTIDTLVNSTTNYNGDGIYISSINVDELNFYRNIISNVGNGVYVIAPTIQNSLNVNENTIDNVVNYGIYLGTIDSLETFIDENTISNVKYAIWINSMSNTNESSFEINDNTITSSLGVAIDIESSASDQTFTTFTINYNEFIDCTRIAWVTVTVTDASCTNYFSYNKLPVTSSTKYAVRSTDCVIDCSNNYHLNGDEVVTDYETLSATTVYGHNTYGANVINYATCITSASDYIGTVLGIEVTIDSESIDLYEQGQVSITGEYISASYALSAEGIVSIDESGLVTPLAVGEVTIIVTVETSIGTMVKEINVSTYSSISLFVVDSTLTEGNNVVTYKDKEYKLGLDAFATITEALEAASISTAEEKTIYTMAGTYSESFTISLSNITLLGANSDVLGTEERSAETILTGVITLGEKVSNTTIQGFKFTGTSMIQVDPAITGLSSGQEINNDGINFINNYVSVEANSSDGFLSLGDVDRYQSKDVVIDGNYFTGAATTAMIYFMNNVNLTVTNNTFENIAGKVIHADDTSAGRGISGNLNVSNNVFNTVSSNVIYIGWLDIRNDYAFIDFSSMEYKINDNEFTNITESAILFNEAAYFDADNTLFQINNNTFSELSSYAVELPEIFTITSSVNDFQINGNEITSSDSDAIYISQITGGNISINENTISGVNTGINIQTLSTVNSLSINQNTIDTMTNYGIYVATLDSVSTTISENTISNVKYAIWINSMSNTNESSFEINDNTITSSLGVAIDIESSASDQTFTTFTINYNEFIDCTRIAWVTVTVTDASCTNYFSYNKLPVTSSTKYAVRSTDCVIDCSNNYHLNGDEVVTDYETLSATTVYGHNTYGANVINYATCIISENDYLAAISKITISASSEVAVEGYTLISISGSYSSVSFVSSDASIITVDETGKVSGLVLGDAYVTVTIVCEVGTFSKVINFTVVENAGTITFFNGDVELSELNTTYLYGEEFILPTYEVEGYTFVGWSLTQGDTANVIESLPSDTKGDIVLYLVHNAIKYTATFYNGDKEITSIAFTFTVEDELELPEYHSNGCEFKGWYLESDLINQVTMIEVGTNENKVFYLKETVTITQVLVLEENSYSDGTYIEYMGVKFLTGKNVYTSISEAINNVVEGGTVYIQNGTYNEDLIIESSNLTFIGNNYNISPIDTTRNEETILSGSITINVNGITFNGFNFTGSITSSVAIDEFTFEYNNGCAISFSEANDVVINTCLFENSAIEITSNESINVSFSKFDTGTTAITIDQSYGDLIFENNTFTDFTNVIYVYNTSLTSISTYEVSIQNNKFINISNLAIALNDSEEKEDGEDLLYTSVKINTNIFNNVLKCVWYSYITTTDAVFNYNIIHYKNGSNPYVLRGAGDYTEYTIDCSKNLYLTAAGAVSSYSSFVYNNSNTSGEYAVNYTTYYSTIESYFEAVGTLDINVLSDVIELNEQVEINVTYTGTYNSITYVTSNEEVVVVSDTGVISAVDEGNAVVTVIIDTEYGLLTKEVYITVINNTDGLYDLKLLLAEGNKTDVYNGTITYYGSYAYDNTVYGSVNSYYPGKLPSINSIAYEINVDTQTHLHGGVRSGNIEFITIHDTGNSYASSTAAANANYTVNDTANTQSSYQYVVDESNIYQILPDNYISFHAGDGGYTASLYSTGIAVTDMNHRPLVTVGSDGYYYLDGVKSSLTTTKNLASGHDAPTETSSLNEIGIPAVIKNGYYYLPTVYYNSSYSSYAIRGGASSIGIESCVNDGSDIYQTWHYLAKLSAKLLVTYSLTPDRVLFHTQYSGKNCPQTMIRSNQVENFLDMVYLEYYLAKNYSDYTITFESSNTDLVDNNGRLLSSVLYTTYVPYTITITNGTITETITLTAVIKGTVN